MKFCFNVYVGYVTVPGYPVSLLPWETNSVERWTSKADWTTRSVISSTLSSASNTLVSTYFDDYLDYFFNAIHIQNFLLWILVLCKKLILRSLLLATFSPPSKTTVATTTSDPEIVVPNSTTINPVHTAVKTNKADINVEKPQCDPLEEYDTSWPSVSKGEVVSCPCKTGTGTILLQHSNCYYIFIGFNVLTVIYLQAVTTYYFLWNLIVFHKEMKRPYDYHDLT